MATGIVVGLSRHRDGWSPTSREPLQVDNLRTSAQLSFQAMSPAGHQRSYSDKLDRSTHPRLPSMSDFLEGAGRPDLPRHPSLQSYSSRQAFQSDLSPQISPSKPPLPSVTSPIRPPLTSSDKLGWATDVRPVHQKNTSQDYPSSLNTEPLFSAGDFTPRPGVTRLSFADRPNPDALLYSGVSPHSNPTSPNASTTTKKVIGEEYRTGQGLCWVYDDGTICPKVINGDMVNPKWGTTKAGKPRKRLGQACNTCREKKIKCDPNIPKCTQCQKFGRECRFEAPSRAVHKSPRMRPGSSPTTGQGAEEFARTRRPSVSLTERSSPSESGTMPIYPLTIDDNSAARVLGQVDAASDVPTSAKRMKVDNGNLDTLFASRLNSSSHEPYHAFALEIDPIQVNRKLAQVYLHAYLTHVNNSTFSLVPEPAFLKWMENEEDKSPVSKLVLYCMLAVGCIFAKNPERTVHGQHFASIALEGIMQSFGHFSLQLIQARLIFAIYEFHNGKEDSAWDLCGAAIRAAGAMKLNTEEGITQRLHETGSVYGLAPAQMAECMRRTFWTAYTMERFGAACLGFTTTINTADCFLRLPCTQKAYMSGQIPKTTIFHGEIKPITDDKEVALSALGILAYMVQIASLCCDVHTLAFRAKNRASNTSGKKYLLEREELESQLRIWEENYSTHIRNRLDQKPSLDSDASSVEGGLHVMYHFACMQLHRHVFHKHLHPRLIAEHVRKAYCHASKTLQIAEQLTSRNYKDIRHYDFAASSPLSGYAILSAIDILTAAGDNAKLLEDGSPILNPVLGSVQLLDSLTDNWSSAKTQQRLVSERIQHVMSSAQGGLGDGKVAFFVSEPISMSLGKENDIVYGIDRLQYLSTLGWASQVRSMSDLVEVTAKVKRAPRSMWKD